MLPHRTQWFVGPAPWHPAHVIYCRGPRLRISELSAGRGASSTRVLCGAICAKSSGPIAGVTSCLARLGGRWGRALLRPCLTASPEQPWYFQRSSALILLLCRFPRGSRFIFNTTARAIPLAASERCRAALTWHRAPRLPSSAIGTFSSMRGETGLHPGGPFPSDRRGSPIGEPGRVYPVVDGGAASPDADVGGDTGPVVDGLILLASV